MTYEENLINTATDLMFKLKFKSTPQQFDFPSIQVAEYCLKKQAEAYRMGILMYGGSAKHPECEINSELKQLGLIP